MKLIIYFLWKILLNSVVLITFNDYLAFEIFECNSTAAFAIVHSQQVSEIIHIRFSMFGMA